MTRCAWAVVNNTLYVSPPRPGIMGSSLSKTIPPWRRRQFKAPFRRGAVVRDLGGRDLKGGFVVAKVGHTRT